LTPPVPIHVKAVTGIAVWQNFKDTFPSRVAPVRVRKYN